MPAERVAIIADGNGRWATARQLPIPAGHEAGADTLRERLHDAVELGIAELTIFFFSTENWARPTAEVNHLMSMLAHRLAQETPSLHRAGIRMRFIGSRQELPEQLVRMMTGCEALTAENRTMTLFIAVNYGGLADILQAAERYDAGGGEDAFRNLLYAPDMHDPELVIRTGGEQRISNFLLWQAANAELVFRDELWPDFDRRALEASLSPGLARSRFDADAAPTDRNSWAYHSV